MSTPNADSCPRLRRRQLGTLAGLADQQLKKWEISFRGRHRSRPDTICAGPESAKCPRLWDFYFVLKEPHPKHFASSFFRFLLNEISRARRICLRNLAILRLEIDPESRLLIIFVGGSPLFPAQNF